MDVVLLKVDQYVSESGSLRENDEELQMLRMKRWCV